MKSPIFEHEMGCLDMFTTAIRWYFYFVGPLGVCWCVFFKIGHPKIQKIGFPRLKMDIFQSNFGWWFQRFIFFRWLNHCSRPRLDSLLVAKAHLDATAAVMAVFFVFPVGWSEASWVDLKIGPQIWSGWWWLEHAWIMTFPSYWEYCNHHNCYSLHHFSEGLVAQPPTSDGWSSFSFPSVFLKTQMVWELPRLSYPKSG